MTRFDDEVRAGLRTAADIKPVTEADWGRVQAKIAAAGPSSHEVSAPIDGPAWVRRWRTPLLVAAVVAAVAMVTVAVIGLRPGDQTGPAGVTDAAGPDDGLVFAHYPGDGDGGRLAVLRGTVVNRDGCLVIGRPMDKQVVIPVFAIPATDPAALQPGDAVSLTGGYIDADSLPTDVVVPAQCRGIDEAGFFGAWELEKLDAAPRWGTPDTVAPSTAETAADAPVAVPVAGVWSRAGRQQFTMELMGGALRVSSDNNSDYLGDDLFGDESPLGLVRAAPARPIGWSALDPEHGYSYGVIAPHGNEGGSYLYGVAGPAVDRIAVLTSNGAPAEDGITGDLVWMVGPADSADAQSTWTSLPDGRHRAFAIQAPAPSTAIIALALGADGQILQARRFAGDGQVTDLPVTDAPSLDSLKAQAADSDGAKLQRAWDHLRTAPASCPGSGTLPRPSAWIEAWTVVDGCRVVLLTQHTLYLASPEGLEILSADLDIDDLDLAGVAVTGDTVWLGTTTTDGVSDRGESRLAMLAIDRTGQREILLPREGMTLTAVVPFGDGVLASDDDATGAAGALVSVGLDGTVRTVDHVDPAPFHLAADGDRIAVTLGDRIDVRQADGSWLSRPASGDVNITDVAISGDLVVASVNVHDNAHVPVSVYVEVSTDGGRTWDRTDLADRNYIESIDINADGTLLAAMAGENGATVLASTDHHAWAPVDGMPADNQDLPVQTAEAGGNVWVLADTLIRYPAP